MKKLIESFIKNTLQNKMNELFSNEEELKKISIKIEKVPSCDDYTVVIDPILLKYEAHIKLPDGKTAIVEETKDITFKSTRSKSQIELAESIHEIGAYLKEVFGEGTLLADHKGNLEIRND